MLHDEAVDLGLVAERFSRMNAADRKAVLASLNEAERHSLTSALAQKLKDDAEEDDRKRRMDRQFSAYSPTMAQLLESAVKDDGHDLAPAARVGLVAEHQALLELEGDAASRGWRGLMDQVTELLKGPRKVVK